ncbi:5-bromo-4-chloroindolyl phosphate hydrolysis family protein [Enterococcus nangangensis]|uniref:5-bromo-4-chloroindolyl phosphate hydrolysis family protein n=1 Tax=Enterococcus nangangensis TaxID=2559926 RepID=UPI0010F519AB|nr:5-bromo-4-chloroindolyl phosphate hydrolysis family protein [Enterococcus nangangensis]
MYLAIIVIIIVLTIFSWSYKKWQIERVYRQRIDVYQKQHQLSSSELTLFRDTLGAAKEQILIIDSLTRSLPSLRAVEAETGGLKSAKQIFQQLMQEPQALNDFGDFLYQKLPSLVKAAEKLQEIKNSGVNTPEIKSSVNKILETITVIANSITDDYESLINEDSQEISLTKKILEKK